MTEIIAEGDWAAVQRLADRLKAKEDQPVPQVRVYNSANISHATSGAFQALTFDSERFDNGDLHSTSANTGRLTASVTGVYMMSGGVQFAANATGNRGLRVRLNGATSLQSEIQPAAGGGDVSEVSVATIYRLAAGDYVELLAYQSSGGALNMLASSDNSPVFWMVRLAGYSGEQFS